jgi:hypothetical protein
MLHDCALISRSVNGARSREYAILKGRTPEIERYRAERMLALLEATSDLSLEDLRALARLKRNNNVYWKCILAFMAENRFTPEPPLVEIELSDNIDSF